jgi:hypothetical protein
MTIKLVPHVYRQEIMIGKSLKGTLWEEHTQSHRNMNTSPINFFLPPAQFSKEHPHWNVNMVSTVILGSGDCQFIPAYYHFQMTGFRDMISNSTTKDPHNPLFHSPPQYYAPNAKTLEENNGKYYDTKMMTAVQLMYQPNSELLETIFNSV